MIQIFIKFNNMEENGKGKSWLYRLKYLKMWKNSNSNNLSTLEPASLNNQRFPTNFNEFQSRNDGAVAFRRNFTTNSLDGHAEYVRTGSQLRKSLRKWHRRMKNCFSKNVRHADEREAIHISATPASSNSSRVTLATQSCPKENIYTLDPIHFQHQSKSPVSDRTSDSTFSPVFTPSRYIAHPENIPTPPPRILGRRQPPLVPIRNSQCPFRTHSHSESLNTTPPVESPLGTPPFAHSSPLREMNTERTSSPDISSVPTNELTSLAYCTWYWGPASRSQVDKKLSNAPDGSFLVRDSTSDRYIFSISFRSVGITLHSRIEYTSKSGYKLFDHDGYSSVKELIEQAMEVSKNNIYCYTKNRGDVMPNYPVRLTKPISRYDEVRSLQNLARFVIRQNVNLNDIDSFNLPNTVIKYLKEETIF